MEHPNDALDSIRSSSNSATLDSLLALLREEKEIQLRGRIYNHVQVEMTYHSNHIEGNSLSLEQTRFMYETEQISLQDSPVPVDDIIETSNHFRAIDYVIDKATRPLSEGMIKHLHLILKSSTTDAAKPWFAVGDYKKLPNEVGGRQTSAPENVPNDMQALIRHYAPKEHHSLNQILEFHVQFERIHPFQDGNGRVGRLIMFKECLANGIVPFIITDDLKLFYYRGLQNWTTEKGYLTDICLAAQDAFKQKLDYFRIPYATARDTCR